MQKLLSYPQVKRLINVSDQYDSSPLHIASQQGYLDVVKVRCALLLEIPFQFPVNVRMLEYVFLQCTCSITVGLVFLPNSNFWILSVSASAKPDTTTGKAILL